MIVVRLLFEGFGLCVWFWFWLLLVGGAGEGVWGLEVGICTLIFGFDVWFCQVYWLPLLEWYLGIIRMMSNVHFTDSWALALGLSIVK